MAARADPRVVEQRTSSGGRLPVGGLSSEVWAATEASGGATDSSQVACEGCDLGPRWQRLEQERMIPQLCSLSAVHDRERLHAGAKPPVSKGVERRKRLAVLAEAPLKLWQVAHRLVLAVMISPVCSYQLQLFVRPQRENVASWLRWVMST